MNPRKIPRSCRADKLDSWVHQVGAIWVSLGFPVLSGHAHPIPGMAPVQKKSRGTSFIYHAQCRGLFISLITLYQICRKMARGKDRNDDGMLRYFRGFDLPAQGMHQGPWQRPLTDRCH